MLLSESLENLLEAYTFLLMSALSCTMSKTACLHRSLAALRSQCARAGHTRVLGRIRLLVFLRSSSGIAGLRANSARSIDLSRWWRIFPGLFALRADLVIGVALGICEVEHRTVLFRTLCAFWLLVFCTRELFLLWFLDDLFSDWIATNWYSPSLILPAKKGLSNMVWTVYKSYVIPRLARNQVWFAEKSQLTSLLSG